MAFWQLTRCQGEVRHLQSILDAKVRTDNAKAPSPKIYYYCGSFILQNTSQLDRATQENRFAVA